MTSIRIASARGDLGVATYEREQAEYTESQRAMVGARIATLKQGRPEKGSIDPISINHAAASLNVSGPSVKRARAVLDSGTSELKRGHRDTVEIPVITMAELVEPRP